MRISHIAAAIITTAIAGHAAAQEEAASDEPAEGAETAAPEPQPEPPAFNGTASGSVSGVRLNVPVVCTGFGDGGTVTVQSDPGENPAEDNNGDNVVVDLSATQAGAITYSIMAGNALFSLSDDTAEVGPNSLSYAITMSYVSGGEDTIELTVTCEA